MGKAGLQKKEETWKVGKAVIYMKQDLARDPSECELQAVVGNAGKEPDQWDSTDGWNGGRGG